MTVKAGYSTPMLHAADIENSIRFYQLLGFTTIDSDGSDPVFWARLHCEDGSAIMLLRAEHPLDASAQALILVLYTPDLPGLREHLLAHGLKAGPIAYPPYMPSGQLSLTDPDGFRVSVCHWGKQEQVAWEKKIGRNA